MRTEMNEGKKEEETENLIKFCFFIFHRRAHTQDFRVNTFAPNSGVCGAQA